MVEQLLYLDLIDLPNFFIRYFETIDTLGRLSVHRQIPCREQDTPQICDAVVDLFIGQVQANGLFDGFPSNQPFDFTAGRLIRFVDKPFQKIVAAGVDPVCLRLCISFRTEPVHMVDDVPRAVYIRVPKVIAIIPLPDFRQMIFQAVIHQQLFDFILCKAKLLIKTSICNGQHLEIIQSGEDALLGDTKAACQDCKLQRIVGFQGLTE